MKPFFPFFLLVFLQVFLLALPVQAGPAFEESVLRQGADYDMIFRDGLTAQDCQTACQLDDRCKAWSFVKPTPQNPRPLCSLKSAVPSPQTNRCCISGVKAVAQGSSEPSAATEKRPAVPDFENKGGWLGVKLQEMDADLRATMGGSEQEGVLVLKVVPGSAAEKKGLRQGNVILAIDGTLVRTLREALSLIGRHAPGEKMALLIQSGSESRFIAVTLGSRPAEFPAAAPRQTNAPQQTSPSPSTAPPPTAMVPPPPSGNAPPPSGIVPPPLLPGAMAPDSTFDEFDEFDQLQELDELAPLQ